MRNCGVTKNVVCRCNCRYTVYHTENAVATTLTKALA